VPRKRPEWISGSPLLVQAYTLAKTAHRSQRRASDGSTFLEHVTEVGSLLREAGFDDELVAAGLLHDAVERGTLSEEALREEIGDEISAVVMTLTEDAAIEDFAERKRALRDQVAAAGGRALTVFAADKLSDILGLRRGIEASRDGLAERMGTSVESMAGHYRDSVAIIEAGSSESVFLPVLRAELEFLGEEASAVETAQPRRDTGREWKPTQRAPVTG
jgi:guanosine-3',5'-bis(diphosphate) 3'-pyrophosphohydrolase